MRISIDISQIAYQGTGVANYTSQLVENILKIDKKNEYTLFGISLRQKGLLEGYVEKCSALNKKVKGKIFSIPQTLGNFLWNRLHLLNIESLVAKIDVFHSSDWIEPPSNARKVTTVHDLVIYKYPESSHPDIVQTQKRRLKWVKKESDLIIADSQATKNDIVEILRIKTSRIKVVYPGIKEIFKIASSQEIDAVSRKYNLEQDYILAIGKREPRKNLDRVLSAFEKFLTHPLISTRKRLPELIIVGRRGWGKGIAPSKRVRILGFVPQTDLPALYSGAKIFVYPSLYEGFGLPVVEAMACGCPVITSNRGSLKEVSGDAAIFVDPEISDDIAIKLSKLFIDNNLRQELVKKGKENARRFSWEQSAKKIVEIYEKLGGDNQ